MPVLKTGKELATGRTMRMLGPGAGESGVEFATVANQLGSLPPDFFCVTFFFGRRPFAAAIGAEDVVLVGRFLAMRTTDVPRSHISAPFLF